MEMMWRNSGVFELPDLALSPIVLYYLHMLQLLEAIHNVTTVKTSDIHGSRLDSRREKGFEERNRKINYPPPVFQAQDEECCVDKGNIRTWRKVPVWVWGKCGVFIVQLFTAVTHKSHVSKNSAPLVIDLRSTCFFMLQLHRAIKVCA